ncbi:MAG: hypothetical protein IJ677_02480 [Alphaproteobacteria bacterium]|nr:hypothetical protein [Alphaproteobacteria bacterium]
MKKIAMEVSLMQHTNGDVTKVAMLIEYFQSLHDSLCELCNFVPEDNNLSPAEEDYLANELCEIAEIAEHRDDFLTRLSREKIAALRQPLKLFHRLVNDLRDKDNDID